MKSKKALFEFLDQYYRHVENEYARDGLKHPNIGNETYGKKSMIYLYCGDEMRGNLLSSLQVNDFDVSRSYGKDFGALEVQVNYFKGYHWDE